MKKYLGVKIVEAEIEFKETTDNGTITPHLKKSGYKTLRSDGTFGWIPKKIFELDYKELPENKGLIGTVIEANGEYWEYLQPPLFTRDQLIQFGKYLLSNERLSMLDPKSDPQGVYHSDVENYIESLNKIAMVV